jgi:hypothetical protein
MKKLLLFTFFFNFGYSQTEDYFDQGMSKSNGGTLKDQLLNSQKPLIKNLHLQKLISIEVY